MGNVVRLRMLTGSTHEQHVVFQTHGEPKIHSCGDIRARELSRLVILTTILLAMCPPLSGWSGFVLSMFVALSLLPAPVSRVHVAQLSTGE